MKKERAFWGILFILSAIVLVIGKLGYFPDVNVFSLILTVFLLAVIIKSVIRINFTGILFPIAFICIIYDKQLGITEATPWAVLIAALLGSIGLSMIFDKQPGRGKIFNIRPNSNEYKFDRNYVEDESNIRMETSFGESIKYINTDKLEQVDVSCSFGAMKIYFDNAVMKNNSAVVNINASFAGIELYVPRTWAIDDRTNVFLGGVDEKNRGERVSTNTLILAGNINFAGLEIVYI